MSVVSRHGITVCKAEGVTVSYYMCRIYDLIQRRVKSVYFFANVYTFFFKNLISKILDDRNLLKSSAYRASLWRLIPDRIVKSGILAVVQCIFWVSPGAAKPSRLVEAPHPPITLFFILSFKFFFIAVHCMDYQTLSVSHPPSTF